MAMSGAEIYRNFQDGAGPDGLLAGAAIVNEVAAEYVEEAAAIQKLTARMESAWQGAAAGAAHRGAGPLATEHESSGSALLIAQALTSLEADVFVLSKNSVMPVPPKPTVPDPWTVLTNPGEQVIFEDQVDDYNAATKHNVAVMTDYASTASNNLRELPVRYGTLSDDGAGIEVGQDTTIDVDESDGDTSGRDADGPRGQGSAIEWRRPPGDENSGSAAASDQPNGNHAGIDNKPSSERPNIPGGSTSPGSYTPAQSTPVLSGGEPAGAARPVTATPGSGPGGTSGLLGVLGSPAGSGGPRDGVGVPRGGAPGFVPREGSQPRGGVPREGAFRSAAPEAPARSASGVLGGGRGGSSINGVPVGAAGRGRDEEDREHRRPAFLEGGDPEDLFGSEVLTAPPTIGVEDDD